jgi:hypothetical protein
MGYVNKIILTVKMNTLIKNIINPVCSCGVIVMIESHYPPDKFGFRRGQLVEGTPCAVCGRTTARVLVGPWIPCLIGDERWIDRYCACGCFTTEVEYREEQF